jgi:hypothetical protein
MNDNKNETALYQSDDSAVNDKGEIVMYQPDNSIQLEVRVEDETVWLTQAQMVVLFERERTVITKHINNIFNEGELDEKSNVQFLHIANSDKPVKIYNLDVIISVGYRVKSQRGTFFRRWATKILTNYLLRGHVMNQRIERLERRVTETEKKIDFSVKTALPSREGIFYDGQIFDAYIFASNLIKSAEQSIALIDNYLDESILLLLSKRKQGVTATVYTASVSPQFQLDLKKHNAQYPAVNVRIFTRSHDRFIFIDSDVYHIGASLKDLGKKLFAFSRMEIKANEFLRNIFP